MAQNQTGGVCEIWAPQGGGWSGPVVARAGREDPIIANAGGYGARNGVGHDGEARLRLLLGLSDAINALADPSEITQEASRLLTEHLDVDRGYYVELDEAAGTGVVMRDFVRTDVPSLAGDYALDEFKWSIDSLRRGECLFITDVGGSSALSGTERAALLGIGIVAIIGVPLIKQGALVGAFCVTTSRPRDWTPGEVSVLRDVADRIWAAIEKARAEASLLESETRHRALVDSMDEAVCVFERLPLRPDGLRDYRYVSMNPAMQKMFGIPDLSGQSIRDNFPDEAETWYDDYDRVLETGQPLRIERASDPQDMVLDMFVTRIDDGRNTRLLAVIRDISAQRRAERALRKSEARLRALVNASSVLIYSLNPDWSVLKRLDGQGVLMDTSEPRQSWVNDYIDPEDQDMVLKAVQKAIRTEQMFELEHRIRREDGSLAWVMSRAVPIRGENGEIVEWFGAAIDVTSHHQAMESLSEAQRLEVVGRLSGAIAHDFNNQLLVIMNNIQLAQMKTTSAEGEKFLASAMKAAEVGKSLIKRLVVWAGESESHPQRVNLNTLVTEMSGIVSRMLEDRIAFATDLAADLWPVSVDPVDLDNAILNLALNARDATADGGQISLATSNVTWAQTDPDRPPGARPGDYVCLSFTDTGAGMTEEVQARAFEPFFTTKSQGTGLGLFSIRDAFQRSGGHVTLDSGPGRGTCVKLYIPRASDERPREETPPSTGVSARPATLLLVDDDPAVRQTVRQLVEAIGYRVVEVTDAAEALARLEAHDDIRIVLSDISMPGPMNGRDLARHLMTERPDIGVMLTTGFNLGPDTGADIDRDTGAAILRKPYRLKDLEAALARLLRSPRRPSARP
ncbi:ATP-binding protein [Aestuariicoccus sp. MJ-SS9]|uniref:ATP-binding protein n=1 Tax=Aestuariicoccus sp. MJ-SS9 TaxID=3079855 RepID=UPI00290895BE|nr:ATP-binding protein [Aestuariicoccus sp. MJ-SS9]MDU8911640.1 PAS domain S-box protein [Aestuariicoccus sp. MJ-SS9]